MRIRRQPTTCDAVVVEMRAVGRRLHPEFRDARSALRTSVSTMRQFVGANRPGITSHARPGISGSCGSSPAHPVGAARACGVRTACRDRAARRRTPVVAARRGPAIGQRRAGEGAAGWADASTCGRSIRPSASCAWPPAHTHFRAARARARLPRLRKDTHMRARIVAGNWKLHGDRKFACALVEEIARGRAGGGRRARGAAAAALPGRAGRALRRARRRSSARRT